MTELETYAKECDCPEIQKLKDCVTCLPCDSVNEDYDCIYKPIIDKLIEMLGDKFRLLRRLGLDKDGWECGYYKPINTTSEICAIRSDSARIALVRAVKEVIK